MSLYSRLALFTRARVVCPFMFYSISERNRCTEKTAAIFRRSITREWPHNQRSEAIGRKREVVNWNTQVEKEHDGKLACEQVLHLSDILKSRRGRGTRDENSLSGFYLGFIVWGRSPEWPMASSFLGGSGGMLPRKFFEMKMRWDAIWCILRLNFEKCALTSSRLDDFSDIVTYIL